MQVTSQRVDKWCLALAPLALLGLMMWFAGWTGEGHGTAAAEAAWVLMTASWPALLWMTAAIGIGLPLRIWLLEGAKDRFALQTALGIAAMLFLNASLGTLGVLQAGGSIGAWALTGVGCALAIGQFLKWLANDPRIVPPPMLVWMCLPALAVLLLATTSAPGWLWSTEFGGYDALSYHLELPKEWLALGRIEPLQHNVYSFLPGYVEAAFYHLMVLSGDAIVAVYACQLLHAMMAVLMAWLVTRVGTRLHGQLAGIVAGVLMLGTPWVIVTGSLAYNEMAVTLMLAAGMLAAIENDVSAPRRGVMIGLFAATACGAKLTAVGFAAVPLAVVILFTSERRRWLTAFGCAAIAGFVMLLPWWIRNTIACGNPVFPFATNVFGLGHWTAEQATVWRAGHMADGSVGDRLTALWNQFMWFGMGSGGTQPWKAQWSALPWIGMFGLAYGMIRPRPRRWCVVLSALLVAQVVFWMFLTHLQSRFLLPAVVPLSLGAGIAVAEGVGDRHKGPKAWPLTTLIGLALLGWSVSPARIYRQEAGGAPAAAIGMADSIRGNGLLRAEQIDLGTTTQPAVFVNWVLPEGGKVLLAGESAPLYFRADRIAYNTVWDRGVLSQLMRTHPDDETAWITDLRAQSFTHMLINPSMLQRWEQSNWNDPLITADRVMAFARNNLRFVREYPHGEYLFEVPGD